MPRIVAHGVDLAASNDSQWLAVADHARIVLYQAGSEEPTGEVKVPLDGPSDASFTASSEPRLIVVTRTPELTALHAFKVPSLAPVSRRDMVGEWRTLAYVGDRLLLASSDGESYAVVTSMPKGFHVDALSLRGPVGFAAAAPEDRLLVDGRGQLEFWDPQSRRVLFRLNLALSSTPRQAGFASRGRLLWTIDGNGQLEVFRFSDGLQQYHLDLSASAVAADVRPDASRVAVALLPSDSSPLQAVIVDVSRREHLVLTIDSSAEAIAILEGSAPMLATATAAGVRYHPLASAKPATPIEVHRPRPEQLPRTPPRRAEEPPSSPPARALSPVAAASRLAGRSAPAPAESDDAPPRTPTQSERQSDWRTRLRSGVLAEPARGPGTVEEAREPTAEAAAKPAPEPRRSLAERLEKSAARAAPPSARAAASASVNRTAPAAASAPARVVAEAVPAGPGADWRAPLVAWATELCASPEQPGPAPLDGPTPVGVVAERLGLPPIAVDTLALLYADWLRGGGDAGMPIATLARVAPPDIDWSEALGSGTLAEQGLVVCRRGRTRLRPVIGRLLDGRPPRARITRASRQAAAGPSGVKLVALATDEPIDAAAARLAEQIGRHVAVVDLRSIRPRQRRRRLADAGIEARIFDAVCLVAAPAQDDAAWLPLLGDGPAFIAVDDECPPALAQLPRWDEAAH